MSRNLKVLLGCSAALTKFSIASTSWNQFEQIKAKYPQFVHNRAKNGHYVYYERPGMADVKALTEMSDMDELLRGYVFLTE